MSKWVINDQTLKYPITVLLYLAFVAFFVYFHFSFLFSGFLLFGF